MDDKTYKDKTAQLNQLEYEVSVLDRGINAEQTKLDAYPRNTKQQNIDYTKNKITDYKNKKSEKEGNIAKLKEEIEPEQKKRVKIKKEQILKQNGKNIKPAAAPPSQKTPFLKPFPENAPATKPEATKPLSLQQDILEANPEVLENQELKARQEAERNATAEQNLIDIENAKKKYYTEAEQQRLAAKRLEIESEPAAIIRQKEKIIEKCGEAAGSNEPPDDIAALSILGISGTLDDFLKNSNAETMLQDAFDQKMQQCVNENSLKYVSDKYDNYKKNIVTANIRIKKLVERSKILAQASQNIEEKENNKKQQTNRLIEARQQAEAERVSKIKTINEFRNTCESAIETPHNLEDAFKLFGIKMSIKPFIDREDAETILNGIHKKKLEACANGALERLDKELQQKYKYNIDQAYRIILEAIKAAEAERDSKILLERELQKSIDKKAELTTAICDELATDLNVDPSLKLELACKVLGIDPAILDNVTYDKAILILNEAHKKRLSFRCNKNNNKNIGDAYMYLLDFFKKKNKKQNEAAALGKTERDKETATAINAEQDRIAEICKRLQIEPKDIEDACRLLGIDYIKFINKSTDVARQELNAAVEEIQKIKCDKSVKDKTNINVNKAIAILQTYLKAKAEILKSKCINERNSLVGIDALKRNGSGSLINNCYLNVMFQMLFQMCEFRKKLIATKKTLTPEINEIKNILNEYQILYDKGIYAELKLQPGSCDAIKKNLYVMNDEKIQKDEADDPVTLITGSDNNLFKQISDEISDKTIFQFNPNEDEVNYKFVFLLLLNDPKHFDPKINSIQSLFEIPANENLLSRMVKDDTRPEKYLILQLNRTKGDGRKDDTSIYGNPKIHIYNTYFKLKGVIVWLDVHYIYVTYNDEGDIANIYNNQVVITKIYNNKSRLDVRVQGMPPIESDNTELYMKLIEEKSDRYKLQDDYEEQINQGGYIYLYEKIRAPLMVPVLTNSRRAPVNDDDNAYLLGDRDEPKLVSITKSSSDESRPRRDTIGSDLSDDASASGASGSGSSGPGPAAPAVPPEITETQFDHAMIAIKHLFNIKTIKDQEISNVNINVDKLKKIVQKKYPENEDKILEIMKNAHEFYFYALPFIKKTSINSTTFKYINSLKQKTGIKQKLWILYNNFYDDYKFLGYLNSNIYLYPNPNPSQTRKKQTDFVCSKISQLTQPIYSNRTIPSQIPNLTKRNITRRVTKLEQKTNKEAAAKKIQDDAAAKIIADDKNQINSVIELAKKNAKDKERALILEKINTLGKKLDKSIPLEKVQAIQKEIDKLERSLNRGSKGGTTRKLIQISNTRKKHKATRKH